MFKTTTIFLLLLLVTSASTVCVAQSGNILSQTRTWNSATGVDLQTNDTLSVQMKFISYSADKIEYHDPSANVQVFDIAGTTGTWTNIAQPGSMTYQVTFLNQNGLIIIERTTAGVFLTIDMTGGGSGIKIRYSINSIE
jgi:hypothetical protein